jgi:Phospholipase_D-nuclease N-terminal
MSFADSSYPLLNAFWTMFEFFLWVIWIWIMVFIDIFRSHDLSGWAEALWFLFVLFIPLIGVLVYLIARGSKMHERAARQARQQDAEARAYIQQAAASSPASTADQLTKLADLRDRKSSPLRSSNARRPRPKSWRPHSVRTRGSMGGRGPQDPIILRAGPSRGYPAQSRQRRQV